MLYLGLTNILFVLRYAVAGQGRLRNQLYPLVLCSLFLFSAFRYRVGCDWSGYFFQYDAANAFDWSTLVQIREPIWWAILAGINAFGLPYPVANVISSAIFFFGVHILARRQADPLGFLILLFPILIINMPMSGIRQGAAIGIICLAFVTFIDRRPLLFCLCVFLSAGFHSSALIFLLLVPLTTGRYTKNRLLLAGLLALPGAFFLTSSDAAEVATSRYIGTDIDAAGAAFRVGILALSAIYFFLFLRRKWVATFPQDYNLAHVGAIGMALTIVLVPISTVIGDRFGYYLIPIQTMIFARLPFLRFRRHAALHVALPYLGLLLIFTVWSNLSSHFTQCYLPYQTWIFGFPGGDPVGL